MSGDSKSTTFSESLVLDDSEKGVIITGITDDTIAAKSGLKAGDEIVAATIHLDHLNKNEVLNILKVLEPYDNNMKVLTKNELSAGAGLGSLGLGLKDPTQMLNQKKDLTLDASAGAPVVSLGQSGNLNAAQGLGGEISIPTVNGDLSSLSLSKPSADAGANFTMPSLGLTRPDIKGDLDGTLKAPDVSVSTPQLNTPSTSLNIEKPEMKTGDLKYKPPKFTMPHFNLKAPDLDPKFDSQNTDLDMNGPKVELNGPGVNLETPNADIDAPSGKVKWPHLKWKGPRVKGPDADLNADLSAPDANLSAPKTDVDLSAPDDLDVPSGKVNWPHLKWKKPKLHSPKADLDANLNTPDVDLAVPKVDGGINAPDADINLPKADIKGPGLDMQTPDIDGETPSGKINWPHLKWKKGKYPKADIDPDLNTPDFSTPKIESDINVSCAELNVPKADLKGPDVGVNAPHFDADAPSPKMNWPHLKWKKNKPQGPKADMDLNADLSTPDVDLSVPKSDGEISTPDVDPNLPSADISSKIKFPTLKRPKFQFSGTKGKTPDVDLDADMNALDLSCSPQASLDGPDGNLNVPKADVDVKSPNVGIEPQSGKFKWPTLKKPKWSVSGPKVNAPDVDTDTDVSAPDLSVSTPKMDGAINAPGATINLPKNDLEGPKLDISSPDIDGPSGKLKWFNFKKPKFGTLRGPKADIDAEVNAPDINLSAQKVESGIDSPNLNISVPTANVKGPDVDLNGLDLDLNSPKADLKGLDADLQNPEVVTPGISNMKLPKFGLSGPTAKGPNLNVDADLDNSGLNLSAPTIKGDVSTPDLGLDADLKTGIPKTNISLPDFSLPTQNQEDVDPNLPKANVKGTSLDLPKADLQVPGVSLSSPKMDGNLSAPNINTELPKAELETNDVTLKAPNGDFDSNLGDFKFPHLKFPNLDLSSPEVEVPTVHPSVESRIEAPQVNKSTPGADANISVPMVDLSVPKAEGAGLIAPTVDGNHEKSKMPYLKFPKLNLSGSNVKAPEVDTSANLEVSPDVKVKAPSVEGEMSTPHVSGSAPEMNTSLNTPELDTTAEADTEVKGSSKKIRWPFKWGLKSGSGTDEEGSGADSETDVSTAEVEVPAFKFHRLPMKTIDGIGGIGDTLGLSKVDTVAKDYVVSKGVRLPIVNATSKAGEKIDIMERLKIAKEKVPSANISPTEEKTDIDLKLDAPSLDVSASTEAGDSLVRGGTFKVEKPESVLGVVAPEISTSDENDKLSLSLSNMLGLNIKDSDAE